MALTHSQVFTQTPSSLDTPRPYELGIVCPHPPSHFMATHILMQSSLDHPKRTTRVPYAHMLRSAKHPSYYSTLYS